MKKLSIDVNEIADRSLENLGLKGFNKIDQSKSTITTMKSDLESLINTLEKNVSL